MRSACLLCSVLVSFVIQVPLAHAELPPPFLGEFGGSGLLYQPSGIAVTPSGDVYVVDGTHRVFRFHADGELVSSWGGYGSGPGQFSSPQDVEADAAGNVYVADGYNDRIQKFTPAGDFITSWGEPGSGPGQFSNPTGIALDTAGNLYVTDSGNHRVQKLDSSGAFLAQWGTAGTGDGQFQFPASIAVDDSARVWVGDLDPYSSRVQVFTTAGGFVLSAPIPGPRAIASGPGRVLFTDGSIPRIYAVGLDYEFLTQWGVPGYGHGQFQSIGGLAIAPSGDVYASDPNRIQRFGGPPPAAPTLVEIDPMAGSAGSAVAIRGSGFHAGLVQVLFAGTPAAFQVTSDTLIQAEVPYGAVTGPVFVETWAGSATSASDFVVQLPPLMIGSFYPSAGIPGTEVAIYGQSFTDTTRVWFGSGAATIVTFYGGAQLNAIVPDDATTGPIIVRDGARADTSDEVFTFVAPGDVPVVESMDPDTGFTGTRVKLRGSHLAAASVLFTEDVSYGTQIESRSESLVVVLVPYSALTGPVQVSNPAGSSYAPVPFTVLPRAYAEAPLVSSGAHESPGAAALSGASGLATFSTVGSYHMVLYVRFQGTGFPPGQLMSAEIRDGTCGAGGSYWWGLGNVGTNSVGELFGEYSDRVLPVQISRWTQSPHFVNVGGFACGGIVALPYLEFHQFSPASGAPGVEVALEGRAFTRLDQVTFDGIPAQFTVLSDSTALAIVPDVARTGPIGVRSPSGIVYGASPFEVEYSTPALAATTSIAAAPDAVTIRWYVAREGFVAEVERREAGGVWRLLGVAEREGAALWRLVDRAVVPGREYAYRLVIRDALGDHVSDEVSVRVPVASFGIEAMIPNPMQGRSRLEFTVPDARPARLEVFDVGGRRLLVRELTNLTPGRNRTEVAAGERWSPGVYVVRLTHAGRSQSRRIAVTR